MTYGYFYYPLSDQSKDNLSVLVKNLPLDSLYYSPVIDYISGNVLANAHVTIFYGILQHKVRKGKIEQFLKKNCGSIELFPDTLSLQPGYQNLYQVLSLKIQDTNLISVLERCKSFPHDIAVQHGIFEPHITLAYLKTECAYDITGHFDMNLFTDGLSYGI